MSAIISLVILFIYMWTCVLIFDGILKYMSRYSSDYIIQNLPSFIVVTLYSKMVIYIYPSFLYGELLFQLIFFFYGIKSLILIVVLLIKPLNKSKYYSLMAAIKKYSI